MFVHVKPLACSRTLSLHLKANDARRNAMIRNVAKSAATPAAGPGTPHQHSNRLAKEESPYLLQHAANPVDWFPWGPEALEKAKAEQKPIFLSVGYATCHWCHVMERESFECEETAALMNQHFVNVKVDREERPDVDRVYMSYIQATTGRGGWPMSVWLTPDLEPIYGGSYYPKKDMMQGDQLVMPAFQTVLRRLASLWHSNREDLSNKSADMMQRLSAALSESAGNQEVSIEKELAEHAVITCHEHLRRRFDARLGGFGGAPKFPRPSEIELLMHAHVLFKSRGKDSDAASALHMATFSLDKMAAGGMFDHIGGGFHRYSVDEYWHVPHFEKMLYDQPQLARVYLQAFQLTGEKRYAQVARSVLDYLLRDMTLQPGAAGGGAGAATAGGGFFSAEDADSLDPADGVKKEGAFYLWSRGEVEAALGPELSALFCAAYNVKAEGNCTLSSMSDPHQEFKGRNVPIMLTPLPELAAQLRLPEQQLEAQLAECRRRLHAVRARRPRPLLDNKVVTAWNGMAISALALASRALAAEPPSPAALFPVENRPPAAYLDAALRAASFVEAQLFDAAAGTLRRSFCAGPSAVPGFCDDYANMVSGLLELYECGGGERWLRWAVQLQATQDRLFADPAAGGYFSTSGADPSIKIRIKDDYDGAEPTPSSLSAKNLFRLSGLVPGVAAAAAAAAASQSVDRASLGSMEGDAGDVYGRQARRVLAAFKGRLLEQPLALPKMACAAQLLLQQPLQQVVLAGRLERPEAQALLDAVHAAFSPDKAVVLVDPEDAGSVAFLAANNPQALAMVQQHVRQPGAGLPAAFICQNYTCQAPTSDPGAVAALLKPRGPMKPRVMTDVPWAT